MHGIGRHDDFNDEKLVGWDSSATKLEGGNHELREGLEAVLTSRLRLAPMWLTVNSIEWHTALHDANVDELLQRCAPDGVPELRAITKDYIMDILYYGSVATGQRIVDTVASQLNIKYYAFLAERPGWSGAVSILGHSLGSVIVVDLLMHGGTTHRGIAYPTLAFDVNLLFTLGSPAAPFLIARQQVAFATDSPPTAAESAAAAAAEARAAADAAVAHAAATSATTNSAATAAAAAEAKARAAAAGERAEAAKAAAAGASTVEAAAGGGTIRCQALLNVFNPVDPVAHLYAPWLGRAHDGTPTVKPVDAAAAATAANGNGSPPAARPLPSLRALRLNASIAEVVAFIRGSDRRADVDVMLPPKGWVVSDILNAGASHGSYWYSMDVAFFVLLQLLLPWADAHPTPRGDRDGASPPPPATAADALAAAADDARAEAKAAAPTRRDVGDDALGRDGRCG